MKHFLTYILPFAVLIGLYSCDNSTTTVTTSNIAKLKTFYLTGNDSLVGLKEATFTIDERVDTGLVHNEDSIRFGTPLTQVHPYFTCETTPGSVVLQMGDSSITISGSDTLDFTQTPIYMTITSSDLTVKKTYEIQVTVHQVDPDLYEWKTLTTAMYPVEDEEQQVVLLNGTFYLYCNNGFSNRLFSSADAVSWKEEMLTGLPDVCRVKGIMSDDKKLYYADLETLYTSTDALNWTSTDYSGKDYTLQTMLMTFNDTVWLVLEDTTSQDLYLGQIAGDTIRRTETVLDASFPVSGFATVTFENLSERKRASVIGGYARDGQCINSRWNIEYAPTIKGLYRFVNYSIEQPEFTTLTGVSVIWYKNQLMMFGGVDKDMTFRGDQVLVSQDEGFTWVAADTTKCRMPETYTARQKQSVLLKDNNIYVIGGQNQQETFGDAYRGRLNSIDWDD